eukprot:540757-Heterocapsa_arctica.AAC.1
MAFRSNPGMRCPAASNPMPEANVASLLMCERRRGWWFPTACKAPWPFLSVAPVQLLFLTRSLRSA